MIGQAQVTDPLMTALRGDRIGHAYLFSGPRGCGKTTSARILARCLNCAEGPTDTPCGTCDSCVELSRAGGGSLDVIEIDAASHNGVDDARDLRERAVFAPSRDRYKIFILDEAHMVTPQGFNALLKLVEEPPEHVKFIFATTEPDKVIGTIRSRTHHYPFRLVPPAAMLEYVESLCAQEGIAVEPGVLPLVVRAGGGSPRDTLSILDQLIAGSDESSVGYERAVALLGYTHGELLDGVVEAFASDDAGAAFSAVDRVVQTGQDPRRFVDDLLERLRDLIIIAATGAGAAAVLRGTPTDELERMSVQAQAFGSERLSRTADIVSATLDEMGGATAPRLQLELMIARVLTALRASAAAAQSALGGERRAPSRPHSSPVLPRRRSSRLPPLRPQAPWARPLRSPRARLPLRPRHRRTPPQFPRLRRRRLLRPRHRRTRPPLSPPRPLPQSRPLQRTRQTRHRQQPRSRLPPPTRHRPRSPALRQQHRLTRAASNPPPRQLRRPRTRRRRPRRWRRAKRPPGPPPRRSKGHRQSPRPLPQRERCRRPASIRGSTTSPPPDGRPSPPARRSRPPRLPGRRRRHPLTVRRRAQRQATPPNGPRRPQAQSAQAPRLLQTRRLPVR